MRPLETLVVLGELIALVRLLIPAGGDALWLRLFALQPAVAVGAQLLVEGARWQVIPAYALAALLLVVGLLRTVHRGDHGTRPRWPRRLTAGLTIGLGLPWLAAAAALPVVVPVFHFPRPTGPYHIGTVTYQWVDASRREIFSSHEDARRELMAQVWYPAEADTSSLRAPYVEDAAALSPRLADLEHLPPFTFEHLRYVATNAIPGARVAIDRPAFPVLIYLTGLAGFRQVSTFQVEELVSHGYVVVGIDQPYTAAAVVFPDGHEATVFSPRGQMQPLIEQSISPAAIAPTLNGRALATGIVPYLAQDVGFTLDRLAALNQADPDHVLTGRLDLRRVGTFGVSLGAMVAAEACRADPRLHACLLMDAAMPADVVLAGLGQPAMWITRDAATMRLERQRSGGWPEVAISETLTTMRAVFAKSRPGEGFYVEVPGIFHVDFTDAPLFTPLATPLGISGTLGTQRAHEIVNGCSVAFFDHVLGDDLAVGPSGLGARCPETALSVS